MIKKLYRFLSPKFKTLFLEYDIEMIPRYGHGKPPHPVLYEIINRYRLDYANVLKESVQYIPMLQQIKQKNSDRSSERIVWNNGYLSGLDIAMLYAILALKKPKKYIEVGSGYSTLTARKAITDQNMDTRVISIDPSPRAQIDAMADQVIRKRFEDIAYDEILGLEPNDVLFIDNSHRILPNSDSMVFFLEILPRMRKGVIVHIHDVYLPYDYPPFMCDRFYSEQYGLAMYLLADSNRYKPFLPNYFIYKDQELNQILQPLWDHPNLAGVEQHGGSFWLEMG